MQRTHDIAKPTIPRSFYGWVRLLSLDVVLGAIGSGWMVDLFLRAKMNWAWYVSLGTAVWLLYTLDHLLDAHRLKEKAHTPRHLFHHRYFKPIAIVWCVVAAFGLIVAFGFLGRTGVLFGLGMGALALLHLLIVKLVGEKTSPFLVKEAGVALVYSLGIWGLPAIETVAWNFEFELIAFIQFSILALINLLEFSLYEHEIDTRDGHTSFVRAIGPKATRRVIGVLLGISFLPLLFLIGRGFVATDFLDLFFDARSLLILSVHGWMSILLTLLLVAPAYFSKNERYRAWGDGAFLIPWMYPLVLWIYPF